MSTNRGELVEAFTVDTEDGTLHMELRLTHAEDGTEMLNHHMDGHFLLCHPAARCTQCNTIIAGNHAGGRCGNCMDGLAL